MCYCILYLLYLIYFISNFIFNMYLYIFKNNYSVSFQRGQFKPFTVSCILTILQYMLHLVSRENYSNYLLFLGQINLALNVEAITII